MELVAQCLANIAPDILKKSIFVPIPQSNQFIAQGGPENQSPTNRIVRILEKTKNINPDVDFCELIQQIQATPAVHKQGTNRLSREDLEGNYKINQSLLNTMYNTTPLKEIIILDDLLTSGQHYCAMKTKIQQSPDPKKSPNFEERRRMNYRPNNIKISGMFIARRKRTESSKTPSPNT